MKYKNETYHSHNIEDLRQIQEDLSNTDGIYIDWVEYREDVKTGRHILEIVMGMTEMTAENKGAVMCALKVGDKFRHKKYTDETIELMKPHDSLSWEVICKCETEQTHSYQYITKHHIEEDYAVLKPGANEGAAACALQVLKIGDEFTGNLTGRTYTAVKQTSSGKWILDNSGIATTWTAEQIKGSLTKVNGAKKVSGGSEGAGFKVGDKLKGKNSGIIYTILSQEGDDKWTASNSEGRTYNKLRKQSFPLTDFIKIVGYSVGETYKDNNTGIFEKLKERDTVNNKWYVETLNTHPRSFPLPYMDEHFVLANHRGDRCVLHDWKEYVGFTERYEYCTKCDEKKESD